MNKIPKYDYSFKPSLQRIHNRKREQVKNTGKRTLSAMKKGELTEFCWSLVQHYNVAVNRGEIMQSRIDYLENLIVTIREQAGNIRTGTGEQY